MKGLTDFLFDHADVPTATSGHVHQAIAAGKSCLVAGMPGSGKTHAVRRAVNGAVWIDVDEGPLRLARFFCDAARQVPSGREVLTALATGDVDAAWSVLTAALGDKVLVVDNAERLTTPVDWGWDEPAVALLSGHSQQLLDWVLARAGTEPTVLVTSRRIQKWKDQRLFAHQPPDGWNLKLLEAPGGYRDWKMLANDYLGKNPGGLVLASLAVVLLSAHAYEDFLEELRWEKEMSGGGTPLGTMGRLVEIIRIHMPTAWQHALALADALDGMDAAVALEALSGDQDARAAYETFSTLGLIVRRHERATLLPIARSLGLTANLRDEGTDRCLSTAASKLLESVAEITSPEPQSAERVFRAHSLYVTLGDIANAQRTAHLHVAGLIDLARRTSLAERWDDARRQYERIRDMLPERSTSSLGQRTKSYVIHYWAYNGRRAETIPRNAALDEYQAAIQLWGDNALWRKRFVSLLIELGRFGEAESAIAESEQRVPDHPRRAAMLRLGPAWTALRAGAELFALRLVESVTEESVGEDPEGLASLRTFYDKWQKGVPVAESAFDGGRLVLHAPQTLALQRLPAGRGWLAQWLPLFAAAQAETPSNAVRELAGSLAKETAKLISTPTHLLDAPTVVRKGQLIGMIDLVSSHIGLSCPGHRWILGKFDERYFAPVQTELGCIDVDPAALPAAREGLFFGRVPTGMDGLPSGPVDCVKEAGSGRSLVELLRLAKSLPQEE